MASIATESAAFITLCTLQEYCQADSQYQKLLQKVKNRSFAENATIEEPLVKEFYNVRDRLSIINDFVMYSFEGNTPRLVIPKKLRHQIVLNLRAANQVSISMIARARQVVYSPGMDRDINNHIELCPDCREIAPSKPNEPLIPVPVPDYPFQNVAADLFEINTTWYM